MNLEISTVDTQKKSCKVTFRIQPRQSLTTVRLEVYDQHVSGVITVMSLTCCKLEWC